MKRNISSRQLVMNLFRPKTVRKSLWPSLSIIWSFGVANIKVKRAWRIFYAIIMTVISVSVNIYAVNIKLSTINDSINYITSFETYFKIPSSLVLIWLWEFKGVSAVENSIVELTDLDQELANFSFKINHERFMWKQLITIGGFLILFSSVSVINHSPIINRYDSLMLRDGYTYLLLTISIHFQYYQALIADLVFVMMLEAFQIRFKLANEVFERIAKAEDRMKAKVLGTSFSRESDNSNKKFPEFHETRHLSSHLVMERVDRACRIHRRLLNAVQNLGDAFSLHLCVYCPIVCSHILEETFILVSYLVNAEEETHFPNASAILIIFIASRSWQIISSCSNTSDQANKLGISLYRVPIDDPAVHNQLQEYSVHIIQRKLKFTAGGIFEIDRGLAISILSTVVKYMIVLLQFRKKSKHRNRL